MRQRSERVAATPREHRRPGPRPAAPPRRDAEPPGLSRVLGNQAHGELIQARLEVGRPDDPLELEADRVADEVMRMPDPGAGGDEEEEEISGRSEPTVLRRMCAECEEEQEETLRTKPGPGGAALRVPPPTAAKIRSLRGGGEPLPPSSLAFFQPRLGVDLSGVRVHSGAEAADTARAVRARAFTVGRDIVFAAGEYRPESKAGRHLFAHELAHVVQQQGTTASASRAALVRRKEKKTTTENFEPLASDYIHTKGFLHLLLSYLAELPLDLPVPYARWTRDPSLFTILAFVQMVEKYGMERIHTTLARAIQPQNIELLVSKSRSSVSATRRAYAGRAKYQEQAIDRLLPGKLDVAIAIASAVHFELQASLRRLVKPYVGARVRLHNEADEPYAFELPQAQVSDLPMFHPMDEFAAEALCHHRAPVAVAEARIPADDKTSTRPHRVRDVTITPLDDAPGWMKAEVVDGDSREPPTAEEVAAKHLGDRKKAYQLLAAPPLFAIRRERTGGYVDNLPTLVALRALTGFVRPVLGLVPGVDEDALDRVWQPPTPEAALLASPRADDVALAQAGAPDRVQKVSRDTAVEQLTRSRTQLSSVARLADFFHLEGMIAPARARIDQRIQRMSTAGPDELARWTHHSAQQSVILFEALSGLGRAVSHISRKPLARPPPGEPDAEAEAVPSLNALPGALRESVLAFAAAYTRAAAVSELVQVARGHLQEAQVLEKKSVADALDQLLTDNLALYETIRGTATKNLPEVAKTVLVTQEGYHPSSKTVRHKVSAGEIHDQRSALRRRVAELRARLLAGDESAAGDVSQLALEARRLNTSASFLRLVVRLKEVVPILDTLSQKWQGGFTGDDADLYNTATPLYHAEKKISALYKKWYVSWSAVEATEEYRRQQALKGMDDAEKAFVKYIKDEQINEKLQKAYDLIDDAQFRMMIAEIVTLVGMTLVSMGAGAVAGGIAAGLRLGATAQFLAATAAETLTMGAFDAMLGKDDVARSMTTDAAFNFAQFGIMRAFQGALRVRRARKLMTEVAEEGTDVAARVGFLGKVGEATGQGLIMFGTQFAQGQYEKARKTGQFMTMDELLHAGLQGIGMAIVGAILKRPTERLRGSMQEVTTVLRLRQKRKKWIRIVEKNGNPAAVREMIHADRKVLEAELAYYKRLLKKPKELEHAQLTEDRAKSIHDQLEAALFEARLAELTSKLEPISTREFLCETDEIHLRRGEYEELGVKVSPVRDEADTGVPYFEVYGNDGSTLRVKGGPRDTAEITRLDELQSTTIFDEHHVSVTLRGNGEPFIKVCSQPSCFDLERQLDQLVAAGDAITNPEHRERIQELSAAAAALAARARLGASQRTVKSRLDAIARSFNALLHADAQVRSALFGAGPLPHVQLPLHLPRPELAHLPGKEQAARLGWPEAEKGFHWAKSDDGYPTYQRTWNNPGPKKVYDPATRRFVTIPDPHQGPGVDFKPLEGYEKRDVDPYRLPEDLEPGVVYMVPSYASYNNKGGPREYIARAYRTPHPDNKSVIEWRLQYAPGRRGHESDLYTARQFYEDAAEVSHPAPAGQVDIRRPPGSSGAAERSHQAGQGTGFEGRWGIGYAPEAVNQELQRQGIEGFLRAIHKERPEGLEFIVSTTVELERPSMRWKSIEYRVDAEMDGDRVTAFSFSIGDMWTGKPRVKDWKAFPQGGAAAHTDLLQFLIDTGNKTLEARQASWPGGRR